MVWGVALVTKRCVKPSAAMSKEIEDTLAKIREVLPKLLEGEVEPIKGTPIEFCFERGEYLAGVACFGFTVKHEDGTWGVEACVRARVSVTFKWGLAERTLWADSCTSYGELSGHKSPLDLFRMLNRVLLCAVERAGRA